MRTHPEREGSIGVQAGNEVTVAAGAVWSGKGHDLRVAARDDARGMGFLTAHVAQTSLQSLPRLFWMLGNKLAEGTDEPSASNGSKQVLRNLQNKHGLRQILQNQSSWHSVCVTLDQSTNFLTGA